jgi:hypothetical protein
MATFTCNLLCFFLYLFSRCFLLALLWCDTSIFLLLLIFLLLRVVLFGLFFVIFLLLVMCLMRWHIWTVVLKVILNAELDISLFVIVTMILLVVIVMPFAGLGHWKCLSDCGRCLWGLGWLGDLVLHRMVSLDRLLWDHLGKDRCEGLRWGKHAKGGCWIKRDRGSRKAGRRQHWEVDLSKLSKFDTKEFLVV